MASKYFRATAYHPVEDLSIIADSYGKFDKLWELSSLLVKKGFQILEVGTDENFLDINIKKPDTVSTKLLIRAAVEGRPVYESHNVQDVSYFCVRVDDKIYVPNRAEFTKGEIA